MNKKKLMVLIAALLAVALLITLGVVSSINAKEQARLEAERKQLQEQQKMDAALVAVMPFMEMYDFDDMVCDLVDIPTVGSAYAIFTSEKFGQASDEDKLAFIAEVEYYTEQIPKNSEIPYLNDIIEHGLDLYVISGEYSYIEWISDGCSELRRASAEDAYSTSAFSPYSETIFSMETLHSLAVEASLDAMLQEYRDEKNHSSKDGCKRCGEKGVPLTAAGYCKVCVDCYYTDYYIGWDGEVHADLPY